jgi:hypothetical protein
MLSITLKIKHSKGVGAEKNKGQVSVPKNAPCERV